MGLLDDLFGKETIAQLQVLAKKKEAEVAQLKSSVMGLENLNSKYVVDLKTGGVHRTAAKQPTTFNAHPLTYAALHFTFESAKCL